MLGSINNVRALIWKRIFNLSWTTILTASNFDSETRLKKIGNQPVSLLPSCGAETLHLHCNLPQTTPASTRLPITTQHARATCWWRRVQRACQRGKPPKRHNERRRVAGGQSQFLWEPEKVWLEQNFQTKTAALSIQGDCNEPIEASIKGTTYIFLSWVSLDKDILDLNGTDRVKS